MHIFAYVGRSRKSYQRAARKCCCFKALEVEIIYNDQKYLSTIILIFWMVHRWLTLENNQVASMPVNLACMNSLTHLNMKNNCLTEVPVALPNLDCLRFCYLNSNAIRDIADWHLSSTTHIRMLNIDDNPFPDDHLRFEVRSNISNKSYSISNMNFMNVIQDYPHVVYGPSKKRRKPTNHPPVHVPERHVPAPVVDQEQNANNEDDNPNDDSQASSSEDEDWEHSVATSAIDPSDESSEDNNEDVDDEVCLCIYLVFRHDNKYC